MLELFIGIYFILLPQVPQEKTVHKELRGDVAAALRSLREKGGFEVDYSMFEVLRPSNLGGQVEGLIKPSSDSPTHALTAIANLKSAGKLIKKTVPQQLDERAKRKVPESENTSGLSFATGSMSFQVLQSHDRFMQSCISDPAYFSILRTSDYDLLYFSEQSRLEIAPVNREIMLFSPEMYCSPLPVGEASGAVFIGEHWDVLPIDVASVEIDTAIGGSDNGHTTLIMGGPLRKYPLHCSRASTFGTRKQSLTAIFCWKFSEERGELQSVLHIQESAELYSLTLYEFHNRRPEPSNQECVLVTPSPRSVLDKRGSSPRMINSSRLPPEIAELVEIIK